MNQQYIPPPPPPPTPGANAPTGASVSERQRPSIATNLVRTLGAPSQTPISATSYGAGTPFSLTPSTPSPYYPRASGTLAPPSSAVSPRTMMEPYNPQQWSNRGQVSGAQMVFQHRASGGAMATRESTGMEEAMPSPPPPYSPSGVASAGLPSVRTSLVVETAGHTVSPLQAHRLSTASIPAPASTNFPPPPPQSSRHRERSSSGQRSFFSLASLRKSSAHSELPTTQTFNTVDSVEPEPKPPGARRAASTGQLHSHATSDGSTVPQLAPPRKPSPGSSWKPGMPLPGPPPGPPPSTSRTQSLDRYGEHSSRSNSVASDRSLETPQHRRVAVASNLGPIPPTPADWVDTDSTQQSSYQPLRIDTGSGQDAALTRRPAKRDSTGGGLRERRSRSRQAHDGADIISPDTAASKPNDLIFSPVDGAISRRRARPTSQYLQSPAEINAHSPGKLQDTSQPSTTSVNNVLTPPYTPAASKSADDLRRASLRVPTSASSDRAISQVLHQPLEDSNVPTVASSSSLPPSSGSAKTSARLDSFLLHALDRHRAFIEKEATASSDEERLELFANFLVHESRLRRDRYSEAYNAMAGEIVDMTRDMWRSYTRQGKRSITPSTSMSSFDPTAGAAYGNMPSSASSYEDYTPGTDTGSFLETGEGMERSDSRQWGEAFKPSLSPIPSMNVSTVPEEEGSRGRAPSRWWEQSNPGSNSIGNPERIEKTPRETKYMGVTPADLQDSEHPPRLHTGGTPGPSTESFAFGPDEYPPEKVGWHEGFDTETPIPTPGRVRKWSSDGTVPLDISRLVTLPPPFPRHYPAVKNKHPLLSEVRSEYRLLAENSKIKDIRDAYANQDRAIQGQQEESARERRKQLRGDIQRKVADGSISFAEAAQAEASFDSEEAERGRANARSNFDLFETSMAHPLNTLLTDSLERADTCITQLKTGLDSRNEVSDPNQTQEEGDEHPERLEELTLLKWLFETREQLHKEMFDLHADRSAKYSEVILTPYRIAKQQVKLDEANAFFTKDKNDRQIRFAKDSLKRFEELQQIIDSNVSRGVEDQLSAFWDIAPHLLQVIKHIPSNMSTLAVEIPSLEYEENPVYNAHPLQYLYSLLSHAEKSAYQFIESQVNLLCLLHEVRTATTNSNLRLLEVERIAASPDEEDLTAEMQQARQIEEERLTEDLKDKVGEVERQWNEALGEGLEDCRERVRAFLVESGGWEDGLEG